MATPTKAHPGPVTTKTSTDGNATSRTAPMNAATPPKGGQGKPMATKC